MSLLLLKTKNLSWQDHTLNIEVMLAPLRSTLLLNKHKTLDTKYDKEKALYERQRDACIKDYVVETRLIERRRQKILNRKKELQAEARAKSALEKEQEQELRQQADQLTNNQGRSSSAPVDGRTRPNTPRVEEFHPTLPRLGLKHTPLFGGNLLRPRLFLETGPTISNTAPSSESDAQSQHEYGAGNKKQSNASSVISTFLTGDGQLVRHSSSSQRRKGAIAVSPSRSRASGGDNKSPKRTQLPSTITKTPASTSWKPTPPSPTPTHSSPLPKAHPTGPRSRLDHRVPRRVTNVTFLEFLNEGNAGGGGGDNDNDYDYDNDDDIRTNLVVEVKPKTVEDKVRDFLLELDNFNSRPPTACSATNDSFYSSARSRESERAKLVANRYNNLSIDKQLLEKAFDCYCEKGKRQEDLLKAMKMASKMKAHVRQARNTSLVPTMATFKSSRTFMKILKRQQRRDRHAAQE